MMKKSLQLAINSEALEGKSKAYIQRALRCKGEGDLDQYQLWASLALELQGKVALAAIHPSLIVDPGHYKSLFAAAGINISSDVRTIGARTLFERLGHLSPEFDENVKKFCSAISQRRNAELHSGETPFQSMLLEAWERQYWHAAQLILKMSDTSLDEWLGAGQAKAPKAIIKQAKEATHAAVQTRIQYADQNWGEEKKAVREKMLAEAEKKNADQYQNLFSCSGDAEWETRCPTCHGKAFMTGMQYEEEFVETVSNLNELWEIVEKCFHAEEFHCPVCKLRLGSEAEIEAAGLTTEHIETEEREAEYGPEYGND